MKDLPRDVLLQIFIAVTDSPRLQTLDPDHLLPKIERVCKAWRDITGAHPSLWAKILVDVGSEVSKEQKKVQLRTLHLFLLRSKDAPLSIKCLSCPLSHEISEPSFSAYGAAQLIRLHTSHIRSLRVPLPLLAVIIGPTQFPTHLDGGHPPLPMLEHVTTAADKAEYDDEITDCTSPISGQLVVAPALAAAPRLTVFHSTFDIHLITLPWSGITNLTVNTSHPAYLANHLPLLSALQVLRIRYVRYLQRETRTPPDGLPTQSPLVFPPNLVRLDVQAYQEQGRRRRGRDEATAIGPMFSNSVLIGLRELIVCPPYADEDWDDGEDDDDPVDIQWDPDTFAPLLSPSPLSSLTMLCLRRVIADWNDLRRGLACNQGLAHLELWGPWSEAARDALGFAPVISDLAVGGRDVLFPVLKRLVLVDIPNIGIEDVVGMVVERTKFSPLQEFGYTPGEDLDDGMIRELVEALGPVVNDPSGYIDYVFVAL
ncbi:hypothetical protein GGF50DRAFT_119499 [Schizophyllum commune]